jgi:hypothetical protein
MEIMAFVIPQPQHSIPKKFFIRQIERLPSNLSNETKESKNGNKKIPHNLQICKAYLIFSLFTAIFTIQF